MEVVYSQSKTVARTDAQGQVQEEGKHITMFPKYTQVPQAPEFAALRPAEPEAHLCG